MKNKLRTHKLKRLYKVGLTARVESSDNEARLGEDESKQGRRINSIDEAEEITLVNVQNDADKEMFKVNDLGALEALKTSKPKVKGIIFQEPCKSTTTTTISSQQSQAMLKDKGKAIMIEEPVKPKKKDQIRLNEEAALRLQAEFDEEERLAREKAEKEVEANIALIEEWDDIQAKIDVDYQLAKRLQAQEQEELTIEERATLFAQLLEKRRKHFASKKLVEGKEKRAGEEVIQEHIKKQKVEEDKETAELKQLIKIIPDEEEVAIDAIPLAVKSPRIVDWKIHIEGKKSYYQIVRADGKSQMYMIFSQMLKSFDREDLEDLYKLVKSRYGSTRPVEDLDYLLWNYMKIMFEPHVEYEIYMLVEKKYPLTPPTLSMMLENKLQIDYESEMAYQLCKLIKKQLKKIKSLLDAVGITTAQVNVNTALMKLVLLMNFKENRVSDASTKLMLLVQS
ncbi:hypothetical protein Tco_0811625 [Tanacetum coccineum]